MTWQQVHRLVAIVLSISLVSISPGICLSLRQAQTATPAWWNAAAATALLLVGGWIVTCAVRGCDPASAARSLVVLTAAMLATYPIVAMGAPLPGTTPWVAIVVPSAIGASVLAFPAGGAIASTGVVVVLRFIAESFSTWPTPFEVHIDDAMYAVVLVAAAIVGVEAGYSSARRVEAARRVSVSAYSEAAARRAEEREVLRWDSFVHDTVLSALAVGGRLSARQDANLVRESRLLAQSALSRLADDGQPADASAAQLVGRLIAEIRPATSGARLRVADAAPDMVLPGRVAAALVDATAEAVRNVVRHAATSSTSQRCEEAVVHVVTRGRKSEIEVTVTDRGSGFDLDSVPADRMGLRLSVVARMESVGGSAIITAASGSGTAITLRWSAGHDAPEGLLSRLRGDPQVAQDMTAAAVEHSKTLATATLAAVSLWLGLHGLLALTTIRDTRAPVASLAALAICVGVGLYGLSPLLGRPVEMSDASAWTTCAVAVGVGLLVGPFVHENAITGYANWTPGRQHSW